MSIKIHFQNKIEKAGPRYIRVFKEDIAASQLYQLIIYPFGECLWIEEDPEGAIVFSEPWKGTGKNFEPLQKFLKDRGLTRQDIICSEDL